MRSLTADLVKPQQRPQLSGPQAARVVRVTAGALYVAPDALPDLEVGPCSWSRPAQHAHTDPQGGSTGTTAAVTPPVGTRCLLLLPGPGLADPWVVTFAGWPA